MCLRRPSRLSITEDWSERRGQYTCTTARSPTGDSISKGFFPECIETTVPLASRTCPDRSVPSGNVRDTISLYLGNLTWRVPRKLQKAGCHGLEWSYILKNDKGSIDTTDCIVADLWVDGGHPPVRDIGNHGRMRVPV